MSQQLSKKLEELEQSLKDAYLQPLQNELGENIRLKLTVQDPVYCRTFELKTLYEFEEYDNLDLGNIDMYIICAAVDTREGREEAERSKLFSFRLVSYPATPNTLIFPDVRFQADRLKLILPLVEFITKSIRAQCLFIHGKSGAQERKFIIESGFSEFAVVPAPGGGANHFYTKML